MVPRSTPTTKAATIHAQTTGEHIATASERALVRGESDGVSKGLVPDRGATMPDRVGYMKMRSTIGEMNARHAKPTTSSISAPLTVYTMRRLPTAFSMWL